MEITIGSAILATQAINAILKTPEGEERNLSFKLRYKLYKMKDAFAKDVSAYEDERVKLIKEYGEEVEKEEGKEPVLEIVNDEKLKKFYEKLDEVLQTKFDVDYTKITEAELDKIDDFEIELNELQMRVMFQYLIEPMKGSDNVEKDKK